MAILLIRHGETDANATRVVQRPEVLLSAHGLEQVCRLAARLAGARVGRILSSDLRRAVLSAAILRDATGAPLALDPGLRERDFGDVRGIAYADLTTDIFAPDYVPPNGETWNVFHARVDSAWRRVVAAAEGTRGDLAVVTHGLVCHAIATRHLDVPTGTAVSRRWGNTSLTVVDGPAWRTVALLDCTAHLDEDAGGGVV